MDKKNCPRRTVFFENLRFFVAKLDSLYRFNDDSALAGRFPLCVPHVEVFLGEGIVISRLNGDCQLIAKIESAPPAFGVCDPSFHSHLLHRGTHVAAIVVLGRAEDLNPAAGFRQTRAGQSIPVGHTVYFRDATPEIHRVEPITAGPNDGDLRAFAGSECTAAVLQIKIPGRSLLNAQGVIGKGLIRVIRPYIDDRDVARGCLGEGRSGTEGQEEGEKCRKGHQPREGRRAGDREELFHLVIPFEFIWYEMLLE